MWKPILTYLFSLPKHTVTTSFHVLTGVYPALITDNNNPYKNKRNSNDESVNQILFSQIYRFPVLLFNGILLKIPNLI